MKRLLPVLCLFVMWVTPANGEQIAAVYSGGKFNKFGGTWTGKTTATEAVTTFKIGTSGWTRCNGCVPDSDKDGKLIYCPTVAQRSNYCGNFLHK